nr:EOG090X05UC [Lepidurus arcticus]
MSTKTATSTSAVTETQSQTSETREEQQTRRAFWPYLWRTQVQCLNTSSTVLTTDCPKLENSGKPLEGIKILDLTRVLAGPYCTMILGDLGATVIKIEQPGKGDETRSWGPPFLANESCYFLSINRNKKSICIDLKSPEGREIVTSLASQCDVLIENYLPGKLNAMDLGYDNLKTRNPRLIYCSITGYGSSGPYQHRAGYDVIAASVGGLMHVTGPTLGEPCKTGVALTDLATGLYAHGAIMAALLQRNVTQLGQLIEVNLLSTQVACLVNIGSNWLNGQQEAQRWGTAHASIVPYEAFPTSSGYVTIGAGSDKQFQDLCTRLGCPDLGEDERFKTNALRVHNRALLIPELKKVLLEQNTEHWLSRFQGASFPYGPINTMKQVFEDEQVRHNNLVREVPHPSCGTIRVVGPAVKYSASKEDCLEPPPLLGQHTRSVLREMLTYQDSHIDNLMKKGASVCLNLTKPKCEKKVGWSTETVDNENLGRKKSKCCCIYKKPHNFDESSSSSEGEDECDNCHGHVELRKSQSQHAPPKPPVVE